MSGKRLLTRLSARVFCPAGGVTNGGNPVTIFHTNTKVPTATRQSWAKTCDWESVVVVNDSYGRKDSFYSSSSSSNTDADKTNELYFYMPTGENVSFCAHAAMGAALALLNEVEIPKQINAVLDDGSTVHDNNSSNDEDASKSTSVTLHRDESPKSDSVLRSRIVSMQMNNVDFSERRFENVPGIMRTLKTQMKVPLQDLHVPGKSSKKDVVPTMINVSVARPKTMIAFKDVDKLNACLTPQSALSFENMCDSIDSTGLYMYAPHAEEDFAWETRQFPKSSGYAEDPATGIAAAALAVSLHCRLIRPKLYRFFQGTKMGCPSVIAVENIQLHEEKFLLHPDADDSEKNNKNANDDDDDDDDDSSDDDEYAIDRNKRRDGIDWRVSFTLLGRVQILEEEERELTADEVGKDVA